MTAVKAKAVVEGRFCEVVFSVLMTDDVEHLQAWASRLFMERRGIEVRADQIRIYEA